MDITLTVPYQPDITLALMVSLLIAVNYARLYLKHLARCRFGPDSFERKGGEVE